MPLLVNLSCRDVRFFYAKIKPFREGPQMDLPGQGDVASTCLSLCATQLHAFCIPGSMLQVG